MPLYTFDPRTQNLIRRPNHSFRAKLLNTLISLLHSIQFIVRNQPSLKEMNSTSKNLALRSSVVYCEKFTSGHVASTLMRCCINVICPLSCYTTRVIIVFPIEKKEINVLNYFSNFFTKTYMLWVLTNSETILMGTLNIWYSVKIRKDQYLSVYKRPFPASILYKSTAVCYRPVSYPDGPITARYGFM